VSGLLMGLVCLVAASSFLFSFPFCFLIRISALTGLVNSLLTAKTQNVVKAFVVRVLSAGDNGSC
jgi:hypothetical protein